MRVPALQDYKQCETVLKKKIVSNKFLSTYIPAEFAHTHIWAQTVTGIFNVRERFVVKDRTLNEFAVEYPLKEVENLLRAIHETPSFGRHFKRGSSRFRGEFLTVKTKRKRFFIAVAFYLNEDAQERFFICHIFQRLERTEGKLLAPVVNRVENPIIQVAELERFFRDEFYKRPTQSRKRKYRRKRPLTEQERISKETRRRQRKHKRKQKQQSKKQSQQSQSQPKQKTQQQSDSRSQQKRRSQQQSQTQQNQKPKRQRQKQQLGSQPQQKPRRSRAKQT